MPQVFQVLRCYKCLVFQVHQTKKSIKWECKLCGEKQSVKRHYGIGTARDCRLHVQKLNCLRGEIDELKCSQMPKNQESDEENVLDALQPQYLPPSKPCKDSKWSSYVQDSEPLEDIRDEPTYIGDAEVVLEMPTKRKRSFKTSSKSTYSLHCAPAQQPLTDPVHNITNDSLNISRSSNSQPQSISEFQTQIKEHPKRISHKKLSAPFINKSSKWADFADEVESDVPLSPSLDPSQTCNMFPNSSNNMMQDNINNIDDTLCQNTPEILRNESVAKQKTKLVPPVINKNSKWAQFTEEIDPVIDTITNEDVSNKLTFSLCDDNELDSILAV